MECFEWFFELLEQIESSNQNRHIEIHIYLTRGWKRGESTGDMVIDVEVVVAIAVDVVVAIVVDIDVVVVIVFDVVVVVVIVVIVADVVVTPRRRLSNQIVDQKRFGRSFARSNDKAAGENALRTAEMGSGQSGRACVCARVSVCVYACI